MNKIDEHIDNLFHQKFEHFDVKCSDQDWLLLEPKLMKRNFLKFSFLSFNIYYLFVIGVFAGTSVVTTIQNYKLKKEIKTLNQIIRQSPARELKTPMVQKASVSRVSINDSVNTQVNNINQINVSGYDKKIKIGNILNIPRNVQNKIQPIQHNSQSIPPAKLNPTEDKRDKYPENKPSDTITKQKIRVVRKTIVIKPSRVIIEDTVRVTRHIK